MENDVKAIKDFIARYQIAETSSERSGEAADSKSMNLSGSAIDDESFKTSLSAAFMRGAEVNQPWSTIGVDQWIESSRWWLLRSQMELYNITGPKQSVPLTAYRNLIKASWILVDIIACHPQVPFIAASTHSEVQLLSTELRSELSRLSKLKSTVPDLSELEGQDLRIWGIQTRGPLLRPDKDSGNLDEWTVDGGEQVLFQKFALCELHTLTEPLPCVLSFLAHGGAKSARLVAQNQNGSIVMAITIQKPVPIAESSNSVTVNDEKILLTTAQDAHFLYCLIEATNFYYFGRRAEHTSLENLKAYILMVAVKNQREDVVARLSQSMSLDEDAIERESDGGPVVIASMLASEHLHDSNEATRSGSNSQQSTTPLFPWAVQSGLAPVVKLLQDEQATTDGNDWQGMTPLGLASSCGHESVVRTLINGGADVRAIDRQGCVALHRACFKGHEGVARLLLRSGAEVGATDTKDQASSLHFAVRNGHAQLVRLLIDRGADIEAKTLAGFTPLCEAASLQQEAVTAFLLEEGANVSQRNNEGINAIHYGLEGRVSTMGVRAMLARELDGRETNWSSIRRDRVRVHMDSDWARIYLDSPRAVIELPKDISSNVECSFNKAINITKPPGTSAKFFKFTFEFAIVHLEDTLSFSVGHGSLGTGQSSGWLKIEIVNGGERIGRPTRLSGRNFQVFTGVEVDKTARSESADDRKIYRQLKDQLYENLS